MVKKILFLIFAMVLGVGCTTSSVLANNEGDDLAIKKIIEASLDNAINLDIDSTMKLLSRDFSQITGEGKIITYPEYRSYLERMWKSVINMSIGDLKFSELDIQNDKATINAEYNFKGVNISTREEFVALIKKHVSLVKEGGFWKIIRIENIPEENGPQPESRP